MNARDDKYHIASFQYAPIDQTQNIANKQRIIAINQTLVNAPLAELVDALHDSYHPDANVNVTHPINELSSRDALAEQVWMPLRHAIPDVERRDDLVAGGRYHDADWVGGFGHYVGTFENEPKRINCALARL